VSYLNNTRGLLTIVLIDRLRGNPQLSLSSVIFALRSDRCTSCAARVFVSFSFRILAVYVIVGTFGNVVHSHLGGKKNPLQKLSICCCWWDNRIRLRCYSLKLQHRAVKNEWPRFNLGFKANACYNVSFLSRWSRLGQKNKFFGKSIHPRPLFPNVVEHAT
jgi:hypothetical protein